MKVETDAAFNRFLEVRKDDVEVTSTGRSFHVRAPATRKTRRPACYRASIMTTAFIA